MVFGAGWMGIAGRLLAHTRLLREIEAHRIDPHTTGKQLGACVEGVASLEVKRWQAFGDPVVTVEDRINAFEGNFPVVTGATANPESLADVIESLQVNSGREFVNRDMRPRAARVPCRGPALTADAGTAAYLVLSTASSTWITSIAENWISVRRFGARHWIRSLPRLPSQVTSGFAAPIPRTSMASACIPLETR